MVKKVCTFIVVPNASSRLHKIRVPVSAIYALGVVGAILFAVAIGFGFSYAKMAFKMADLNRLQQENTTLKVENKNLEVSTRQLHTKITALENLSEKITSLMETEIRNGRRGGIGGSREDYPTAEFLSSLRLKDRVDLMKDRTSELTSQLRVIEQFAEHRATQLRMTPSLWPVKGSIRSHYGRRPDPFSGLSEFHRGIDIASLYGSTVRTPADGLVIYSYRKSDYGNVIIIDHGGGLTTRLGHLSRFSVRAGQQVRKGDIVGFVGTTGRTTGPHLHYEVRLNDHPINPRNYLPRLGFN